MAVAFTLLITIKNSFNAKLDTHADTHACEKIRKNAVKHIQFVSMKQEVEIPTRQLYKPSDGDSQYGAGNGTRTHDLRITNGDFDVLQFFAVFNERCCYAVYRHFAFYLISFRMAHFHHDGALMAHSKRAGTVSRSRLYLD